MSVVFKPMFALSTQEIIPIKKYKKKKNNLFVQVLKAYKKLKQIAMHESKNKYDYKVAKLAVDDLGKVKNLEEKFGYTLVAYERDVKAEEDKIYLLNQINFLLDGYLSALKVTGDQNQNNNDDFKKFFEQ